MDVKQKYSQRPLAIQLHESYTLDNFVKQPNRELFTTLKRHKHGSLYIWGEAGTGKSHLLQALCHQTNEQNQTAIYLPLIEIMQYGTAILEGIEAMSLIAVDGVGLAVNSEWEESLFHLFNRIRHAHKRLIICDREPPQAHPWQLTDLLSRLNWGPIFTLHAVKDDNLIKALQLRAREKGLALAEDVGRYLVKRFSNDAHTLFTLLEELDYASLATQRRLTIPFIRSHLQIE